MNRGNDQRYAAKPHVLVSGIYKIELCSGTVEKYANEKFFIGWV